MLLRVWLSGVVVFLLAGLAAAQSCRKVKVNTLNTGQCLTISTTAVTVMTEHTSRCSAIIFNNSANGMNCRDVSDGAVSSTAGMPIPANGGLTFGPEAQGRWQCIRTGAADAQACIAEGMP